VREDFLKIDQLETRIAYGSHVCKQMGRKLAICIEDLTMMLPTKFQFIWESSFRGEDFFRNQPIRNKNGLWWPCLLTDRDEICHLYRGHSINAVYQVSVHLAKLFQRRRFKKIGQSEKNNCLWRPCLLIDWDKICNL
jgi:hypothetical protein